MRNDVVLDDLAPGRDAPGSLPPGIASVLGAKQCCLLSGKSIGLLCSHPLLYALNAGSIDLSALRELLVQHHFYSRNFTRFLCLLVTNLSEISDVRALMQNLLEELGVDERLGETHAELFKVSMRAAGATTDGKKPLDATQELTEAMFNYCRSSNPLHGLAAMCLGAEAIVPLIYNPIIKAMKHLDLPEEARIFFELHVAEDEGHAAAMLEIIMRLIRSQNGTVAVVREVADDMISRRMRFLDGVWAATSLAAASAQ